MQAVPRRRSGTPTGTAGFGEPDGFALDLAREPLKGGPKIGGTTQDVTILDKDSQSNPQRARRVANELINSDPVDLMLTTSTPQTVYPVVDACEAAGVPCISTVVPWEAWYFGRGVHDDVAPRCGCAFLEASTTQLGDMPGAGGPRGGSPPSLRGQQPSPGQVRWRGV